MTRKMKWMRRISIVLCLFLLCADLSAGGVTRVHAKETASFAGRDVLNFNTDWLFSSMDYENGAAVRLDDSGFAKVSVPHANTVLETHKGNSKDADQFPNEIDSYRFISWYRRHFTLPRNYAGKHITVDFEGVATVAEVYLNGEPVGSHKGAYTSFSVDISDAVYTDGRENVLAVRVNSERQTQIPPEGGNVDYCLFGGIVRDVTMTVTDHVHVGRVFVTTPDLMKEKGAVKNSVDVSNSSGQAKTYTVETAVLDEEGKTVATASRQANLAANALTNVEMTTNEIANPHLWDLDDPYLYTAVTTIKDGGTTIDSYETRFGMRFFEFKKGPDDGRFYLNGEPVTIVGINRHEQWPYIGRAVPDKLQVQDADRIKADGINAVRCSHYPQDPAFLDRCDEIGLLVFEEPPGWQHVGNDEWKTEFKYNLEEMILRDRNHASIISWGARPNESSSKGNLPFNRECEKISKDLDPTRPTHGVRWEFGMPGASDSDTPDNDVVVNDLLTVNYRYPENPPHIPYMVTEHSNDWWGDGFSWASDANANKFIDSFAEPVDYFYRNDKVAGGFGWSMFDYDNEVNYTNTAHVFYSGLYDIFRHEKPVAYLYRSQMDADSEAGPIVYISNNWTEATSQTVYVLSNCDEVELFVNNKSKGKLKPNKYTNLPHPIFEFTGIEYEEGELKAVGYIQGAKAGECVRSTPGEPVRLVAKADYETLTADGTDMTSVSVIALDANGNEVPFADNVIHVSQTGGVNATLVAERNVRLEDGKAAFLVQSVRDSVGTAQFTVTSDGMQAASVEIAVGAFTAENLVPAVQSTGKLALSYPDSTVINDNRRGGGLFEFSYQGDGWEYGTEKTAHKGDNHYSNRANDTVSIRFVGTNLKYFGAKAPGHGIAAFALDGGQEARVDCYAANRSASELLFDTGVLDYGEHTLTVRVTGEKNSSATDAYVNADRIEVSAGTAAVVNDHTIGTGENQFQYSDGWSADDGGSGFYQGDNYWSNTEGATLSFRFTGTSVKYYTSKEPNCGIAAFSIDGGEETEVDLYSKDRLYDQLVYEGNNLSDGSHTLSVRVTGKKNAASSDTVVVADKIQVSRGEETCGHGKTEIWNRVAADCQSTGYTGDTYCQNCGEKLSAGKAVPKTDHRWDAGVITKKPTANETGIRTFTCGVCRVTKTETVPKTGISEVTKKDPEQPKAPEKGDALNDKDSKAVYQVTSIKTVKGKTTGTVKYLKPSSNAVKTAVVPSKIKAGGISFTVTAIANKAFLNKKKLTKVTIGSNVTAIGDSAFSGCKKLKTVTIGKNVASIGAKAFYQCASLTKLTIPSKVKKIGKQSFDGCKKLKNITIKTKKLTKKSVGSKAFRGIHTRAVIKVPKKQLKTYRSLLRARGAGKKVTIKK